ncbi:hypothetical protein P692DRAFT_20134939 [Suillus brevipes Sb2]|nr:hypothetical protein P692DRAFT_20134939 [Suillus brevipes Sb2]
MTWTCQHSLGFIIPPISGDPSVGVTQWNSTVSLQFTMVLLAYSVVICGIYWLNGCACSSKYYPMWCC